MCKNFLKNWEKNFSKMNEIFSTTGYHSMTRHKLVLCASRKFWKNGRVEFWRNLRTFGEIMQNTEHFKSNFTEIFKFSNRWAEVLQDFWNTSEATLAHVLDNRALYRSGILNRHLVAVLPNNNFVIISKTMSFYEKCQGTLFACHKILNKKCSTQFLCKIYCYKEKCKSNL